MKKICLSLMGALLLSSAFTLAIADTDSYNDAVKGCRKAKEECMEGGGFFTEVMCTAEYGYCKAAALVTEIVFD